MSCQQAVFVLSGVKWRASQTQTKTGNPTFVSSSSSSFCVPVHMRHINETTCVSGCMYHPAELYSGRNTWDSYSAGGLNRGQWAPVNARPWSHTQRLVFTSPRYDLFPLFRNKHALCIMLTRNKTTVAFTAVIGAFHNL